MHSYPHPSTELRMLGLWSRLRSKQVGGLKFRRQHPLGPYIADFCCVEAMLAIEIDGDTHADQQEYDEARTQYLNKLGYKVVRVTNRDVLESADGVLEMILSECERRQRGRY